MHVSVVIISSRCQCINGYAECILIYDLFIVLNPCTPTGRALAFVVVKKIFFYFFIFIFKISFTRAITIVITSDS